MNPKIKTTGGTTDNFGVQFASGARWITLKDIDIEGSGYGNGLWFTNSSVNHVNILGGTISRYTWGWLSDPWILSTPPTFIHLGECGHPVNIFDTNLTNGALGGGGGYGWFSDSVMAVNYRNSGSKGIYDHNVYFSSGPRTTPTQNMTFECGTYTESSVVNGVSEGVFLKLSGFHAGVKIRNNTFTDQACHTYVIGSTSSNDGLGNTEYVEAEIYGNVFDTSCVQTIHGDFFRNTKIYNNIFSMRNYAGGQSYNYISLNRGGGAATLLGNNSIFNNSFICTQGYCPDDLGENGWIQITDGSTNNKFFNNLLYSTRSNTKLFAASCSQFGPNGADFDNNFVYVPNTSNPGMLSCSGGSGNSQSFTVNPRLTDVANFDFSLQSNSPLINAGRTSGAPASDFAGEMRDGQPDIGAFEY